MIPLEIWSLFPLRIKGVLEEYLLEKPSEIYEIRLRLGRPLQIIARGRKGFSNDILAASYTLTKEDLEQILLALSSGSFYTLEEDLPYGYTTIQGGHRIGFAGQVVAKKGHIETLNPIAFMNIRLAREIKGLARPYIPYLFDREKGHIHNTLIIAPPGAGKTTFLRDLIRISSSGDKQLGLLGKKVGLVDERSELAGCYQGVPQLDVGGRTDVLANCPKNQGLLLLIRAMSPEILACDELGQREDYESLMEISRGGVQLLATIHGHSYEDLVGRPSLKKILASKFFQRFLILSLKNGPGTLEKIVNAEGVILFRREEAGFAKDNGSCLSSFG